MRFQSIFGFIFPTIAAVTTWWWFGRAWKRGEIETRTGLYRADVEAEEYWFTMAVFGVIAIFFTLIVAFWIADRAGLLP
jgi:hypothetical protein